jgi:hypothetical protein
MGSRAQERIPPFFKQAAAPSTSLFRSMLLRHLFGSPLQTFSFEAMAIREYVKKIRCRKREDITH